MSSYVIILIFNIPFYLYLQKKKLRPFLWIDRSAASKAQGRPRRRPTLHSRGFWVPIRGCCEKVRRNWFIGTPITESVRLSGPPSTEQNFDAEIDNWCAEVWTPTPCMYVICVADPTKLCITSTFWSLKTLSLEFQNAVMASFLSPRASGRAIKVGSIQFGGRFRIPHFRTRCV